MDTKRLIAAIVRQTTILIAQISTAAGTRSPLASVADQVFLELSRELEAQGVTRKVAADMFGLALRSYQKKIQRLGEAISLEGGEPTVLAEGQLSPESLVVDETHAYWINLVYEEMGSISIGHGELMRVALSGGTPEVVAVDEKVMSGLTVDETYAYYMATKADDQTEAAARVLKDGSAAPEQFVDVGYAIDRSDTLLVADNALYWKARMDGVYRLALGGTDGPDRLSISNDSFGASFSELVLDTTHVYWTWTSLSEMGVASVPLAGGEANALFTVPNPNLEEQPTGIALAGDVLYWGRVRWLQGGGWRTMIESTVKQTGDTTTLLVDSSLGVVKLAATDQAVYAIGHGEEYLSEGTGVVLRIAQ